MPVLAQFREEHERVRNAIIRDDHEEVIRILSRNGIRQKEQSTILGTFSDQPKYWDKSSILKVSHPVSISVVYQSKKCLNALLEFQSDLVYERENGNNLVHLLLHSASKSEDDLRVFEIILNKLESSSDRKQVLLQRNDDGLTPLELSVKLKCFKLFEAILYTVGVYRKILDHEGKMQLNEFNFYYPDIRSQLSSFLWQVTLLSDSTESSSFVNNLIGLPLVQKLADRKLRSTLLVIILWFILRLIPFVIFEIVFSIQVRLVCYYTQEFGPRTNFSIPYETAWSLAEKEMNERKGTGMSFSRTFEIVSVLTGLVYLIFDVVESIYIIMNSQSFKSLLRELRTKRIVNIVFYRVNSLLFIFSGYYVLIVKLVLRDQSPVGTDTIQALVVYILLCFQILYFIQLLPIVGSFAIGFQKMLGALAKFVALQMMIMAIFVNLFNRVILLLCRPKDGNKSCSVKFDIFTIFGLMLNTEKHIPRDAICQPIAIDILNAIHIVYTFIVVVMIVNYLIAIMSTVYNDYADYENTAVFLHRLHMSLVVERRLRMAASCLPWCGGHEKQEIVRTNEVDRGLDSSTTLLNDFKTESLALEDLDCPKFYDSDGNGMLF